MLIFQVPLALAAPAAVAGLAYLNARTSFTYDLRVTGNGIKAQILIALRTKKDRLSAFYILEDHALGKQANETFLVFEGKQWTYKEFYDIAVKHGTWLKTKYNIKSKQVVAMDFMNSDKFMFVWFGLWSIGAKPAFINYNLTDKALAHCIRASTSPLVFLDPEIQDKVTQEVRDELPGVLFEVYTPELEAEAMAIDAVRVPDSDRSEDKSQNMALLVFTSGTTGLPKPAIVSWTKVQAAGILVPSWMGIKKTDIVYTVRLHSISLRTFLLFLVTLRWPSGGHCRGGCSFPPFISAVPPWAPHRPPFSAFPSYQQFPNKTSACPSTIPRPPFSAPATSSPPAPPSLSARSSLPKRSGPTASPPKPQ